MPSLGKINGLCADYSQKTLNGRGYDKIYERILAGKDFRFNAMMERGGIPCELGHPTDCDQEGNPRTETDPTKVAVILTQVKKAGPKQLVANGVIADTPNGRIFKELSNYYTFGLSSRGSYEIPDEGFNPFQSEGPDGWNQDTYVFKGFDLVLLPANSNSELSVTESLGTPNNKIIRVARESIDVNLLAKASQVSEDQVEEALDQLFKLDQKAEKSEEVPIREMEEKIETQTPEEETNLPVEGEEVPAGEPQEETVETTLITNGEEVEKIKADLQTALDEIEALKGKREEDEVELGNRDAEITKLTSERDDLQTELQERIEESEQLVEKFEALKDLSSKLLESYKAAKEQFDSKSNGEPSEETENLKAELEETKEKAKAAEESLGRERQVNAQIRTELRAAKESLISAYSTSFGISKEALESSLGKSYSVKKIRPAAEALANQASRYSAIPVLSVAKKRSVATESFVGGDEVEKELYDQIKNNK